MRISPAGTFNDIAETETEATYTALLDGLNPLGLLYLHVLEDPGTHVHALIRKQWDGPFIFNIAAGRVASWTSTPAPACCTA